MASCALDTVTEKLRAILVDWPDARLPSRRLLAARLHTSMGTLHDAMRRLEKEGILVNTPRSGTYLSRPRAPKSAILHAEVPLRTEERVYRSLVEDIERGIIRKGAVMPKLLWLARKLGVGVDSVRGAYRRLAREGLVQRKGRAYTFGTWSDRVISGKISPPHRSIMVFQLGKLDLLSLANHERLHGFYYSFMQEVLSYQVRILPVMPLENDGEDNQPNGHERIRTLIDQLGSGLCGILLINRPLPPDRWAAGFKPWLEWFCRQGKPVVWFDENNSAGAYDTPGPISQAFLDMLKIRENQKTLVRCHHDDAAAMRLAIELLYERGHRHAVVPNARHEYALWVQHRTNLLRRAAMAIDSSFVVTGTDRIGTPPALTVATETIADVVNREMPRDSRLSCMLADYVVTQFGAATSIGMLRQTDLTTIRIAATLAMALSIDSPTAFIAPNDHLANRYLECFISAGIRVPEDISLISFDANPAAMYPHSISSIDFGFDYLGYQTFHLLFGDRSVPIDRHRSVPGLCRCTHTGTIADLR